MPRKYFLLWPEINASGASAENLHDQIGCAPCTDVSEDATVLGSDVDEIRMEDIDLVQVDVKGRIVNSPTTPSFDPLKYEELDVP